MRKAAREVGGVAAALVVGEPEADDPPARVLRRQASQRAGVERVAGAVGRDQHPDAQPRLARALGRGVEHQVGERGRPAEPGGVPAGVDLDLQPAAAVARRRPPPPRAPGGERRPRCAAPSGPRRRGAGSGTSPSRRRRSARAASPGPASPGSTMWSRSASSSSVSCRIEPVKWRWRWALGSPCRSRTLLNLPRGHALTLGRTGLDEAVPFPVDSSTGGLPTCCGVPGCHRRALAQLAEHRSPKPKVGGSSPSCPAGHLVGEAGRTSEGMVTACRTAKRSATARRPSARTR